MKKYLFLGIGIICGIILSTSIYVSAQTKTTSTISEISETKIIVQGQRIFEQEKIIDGYKTALKRCLGK